MSSSRDASSFDLNRARELSRRLGQPEPGPAAPPPDGAAPRFSASQVRGVPVPPPAAAAGAAVAPTAAAPAAPPLPPRLPPVPAGGGFEARVGWCREALGADAAFLLDERGLLVACAGGVPPAEAEGVGARLVFTLDQTDAMRRGADRTRSISIEYGASWLTGWRFPVEGVVLTLGILTGKALPPGAGGVVARAFAGGRR